MSLVETALRGSTAWITLRDPGRRNALSRPLVAELTAALDDMERHRDASVVVLTGAGAAFCAGADLADLRAGAAGDFGAVQAVYDAFVRVRRCTLPTVAAVNGPAVGAGLNLALACDVRIAAATAWFEARFLDLGIHPCGGVAHRLSELVGPQAAAALLLFGDRLTAERAATIGLVWSFVPVAELTAEVERLTTGAAGADPDLLVTVKRTLHAAPAQTYDEALALEAARQRQSLLGPAARARLQPPAT